MRPLSLPVPGSHSEGQELAMEGTPSDAFKQTGAAERAAVRALKKQ